MFNEVLFVEELKLEKVLFGFVVFFGLLKFLFLFVIEFVLDVFVYLYLLLDVGF